MKNLFSKKLFLSLFLVISLLVSGCSTKIIPVSSASEISLSSAKQKNLYGAYHVVCRAPDGTIKWVKNEKNLITDEGLNYLINVGLHAGSQATTWYIGLLADTPTPAAADTMTSHAGWTELTAYTGDRKEFVEAESTAKSTTNSASPASFPINADSQTIAGLMMCSAATGTSCTLFSVCAFTGGDETANNGDTLEVTYTVTGADN